MSRNILALVAGVLVGTAHAAPAPELPTPRQLLAQLDDRDLLHEETLNDLNQEEIDREAWSMGRAIGLSVVPGGGFGLIYAEKGAASAIPFVLSVVGYGLGATYLLGVFDEATAEHCQHVPTASKVDSAECTFGDTMPAVPDPRDDAMRPYFKTRQDYQVITTGETFDGKTTGTYIIAGTYLVTTLVGAVWAASAVSDHNEALRKRIESTAQGPRPILSAAPGKGYLGLAWDF